jgi:hypothetical protein
MSETKVTTYAAGRVETATTFRGSFVAWACDASGKVVNRELHSVSAEGSNSTLIDEAWEFWDQNGTNALIAREYAFIVRKNVAGNRPRFVFDCVLKKGPDDQQDGKGWDVPRSAPLRASAEPGMRWESLSIAEPGALFGPAIQIKGNPGAPLFEVSSDMLRDGCVWGLVDGVSVKLAPVKDWPHGPVTAEDQAPDGAGWFAIRDYGHRQEGRLQGTGSFLPFQSMNDKGQWGDWVMLNGGLIDRTAGREQGDLDILWHISGRIGGVAGVGDMSHAGGPEAAFQPILDGSLHLGLPGFRWRTVYAQALDLPIERKRLRVGGKIVECDAVRVGDRWVQVYEAVDYSPQ